MGLGSSTRRGATAVARASQRSLSSTTAKEQELLQALEKERREREKERREREKAEQRAEKAEQRAEKERREREKAEQRAEKAQHVVEANDLVPRSVVARLNSVFLSKGDLTLHRGELRSSRAVTVTKGWPRPRAVIHGKFCPWAEIAWDVPVEKRFEINRPKDDAFRVFQSEASMRDQLSMWLLTSIFGMFNFLLELDGSDQSFVVSGYVQLNSSHIPDRVGYLRQRRPDGTVEERALFAMEEKAPYKYPKHFQEGEPYRPRSLEDHYYELEAEGMADAERSPVVQVYNYMCSTGCKYGVLSTGLYTWFLRRDADGNLYASPTVAIDDRDPTLSLAWVSFLKQSAMDEEKVAVPVDVARFLKSETWDLARRRRKEADREQRAREAGAKGGGRQHERRDEEDDQVDGDADNSDEEEGDDERIHIEDVTKDDEVIFKEHGVVRRALVNHSEHAVLKLVDAQKDWEGADLMDNEIQLYHKVRDLWGDAVPRLYYGGDWSLGRRAMVLGAVGEQVTQQDLKDESVVQQVREALEKLHTKGVAHQDLHQGNILIDRSSGKVTIIDLGLAIALDGVEERRCRELVERDWRDLEFLVSAAKGSSSKD